MTQQPAAPPVSYHTHTELSHCGQPDMIFEAAVAVAAEERYSTVGFSDHIHPPQITDQPAHAARLRQYKRRRQDMGPTPEVFIGGEFDVLAPGLMVESEEIVAECEYFIVAPNHYHVHWVQTPEGDVASVAAHELDTMETAINWTHTDVIVHPFADYVKRPGCTPNDQYRSCDKSRLRELLCRAVERRIALEIQPRYWCQPERAGELSELFDSWLALGGLIAPGSDAHTLESLRHWARCYDAMVVP